LFPPVPQALGGNFFTQWAFIQTQFQEKLVRAANDLARLDIQQAHDLLAIEVWTNGLQFFLLGDLRDARLEVIVGKPQAVSLLTIARGDIRTGQAVQVLEQISRISDV